MYKQFAKAIASLVNFNKPKQSTQGTKTMKLTKMQDQIVTLLTNSAAYGMSTSEITTEVGTTGSSIRRRLTDLKRAGIVAIHTSPEDKPGRNEKVWVLAQFAQAA